MTTLIEPPSTTQRTQRAATWSTEPQHPASMGELFSTLSMQVTILANGEIELNKLKVKSFMKKFGADGVLLVPAAVFALYLFAWVFHMIELAIVVALPAWAVSLITTAILLSIVAVLAVVGASFLGKSQADVPDPKDGFTRDIDALKKGLGKRALTISNAQKTRSVPNLKRCASR